MVCICNLSIWEMKEKRVQNPPSTTQEVWSQPGLCETPLKQNKKANTRTPPPTLNFPMAWIPIEIRHRLGSSCGPDGLNLESLAPSQLALTEVTPATPCLSCQDCHDILQKILPCAWKILVGNHFWLARLNPFHLFLPKKKGLWSRTCFSRQELPLLPSSGRMDSLN